MQNNLYGQKEVTLHSDMFYTIVKRVMDLTLGVILGVFFMPFIFVIAIILLMLFRKNPFYTQKRGISLQNKIFTIIKFRTMFTSDSNDADQRNFILKRNAQRITPFCAWLRKTGLDELPQLINVLKGDMSFIGPRPLSVTDLKALQHYYPEAYAIREKISVKAGVSGYWQIFGDRKLGVANLVEMDMEYVKRRSTAFDCYLIWKTIPVMIMAEHSDAILGDKGSREQKETQEEIPGVFIKTCTVKLNTQN